MHGMYTVSEHVMATWCSAFWFMFTMFVPPLCIYVFMLAMFIADPIPGPSGNTNNVEREELKNVEPTNETRDPCYDPNCDHDPCYDSNCDHSTYSSDDESGNSDDFEESDGFTTPDVLDLRPLTFCDVLETQPGNKKEQ